MDDTFQNYQIPNLESLKYLCSGNANCCEKILAPNFLCLYPNFSSKLQHKAQRYRNLISENDYSENNNELFELYLDVLNMPDRL